MAAYQSLQCGQVLADTDAVMLIASYMGTQDVERGDSNQHASGLGITRTSIKSVFEKREIGVVFEDSSRVQGQPRVSGKAPNQVAVLELIGPEENLTSATMLVFNPTDMPSAALENSVYMWGLLKLAVPDWPEGRNWLTSNLEAAVRQWEVSTIKGEWKITLSVFKQLGAVSLTIRHR